MVAEMWRASFKKNFPFLLWCADCDPESDYRSWHSFFQTLLFPICLEPALSCFRHVPSHKMKTETCWIKLARYVYNNQFIFLRNRCGNSFTGAFVYSFGEGSYKCVLFLLLKEFMATHHKETKCSYL